MPKKKVVERAAPRARKVLTAATAIAAPLGSDDDSDDVVEALRSATASEGAASPSSMTELDPPPSAQRQLQSSQGSQLVLDLDAPFGYKVQLLLVYKKERKESALKHFEWISSGTSLREYVEST